MLTDSIKLKGRVGIVVKGKDGNVKETRNVNNLVVDAGLDYIASRMKDATATAMTHMGLGTGTTAAAAGDTDLGSLAGSREALDSTTVTDNTVKYVCNFEANDVTGAITEAGIFNASTGGTMLCRVKFDPVNLTSTDTISVDWTITISAS
jgi:hypothetical protein